MSEYRLPSNWCWKKLSDIATFIGGIGYDKNDICADGLRVLRGGNIQDGRLITKKDDVFLPMTYDNDQNRIQIGDTCIAASTGSVELLGKAATCFEDLGNTHIGAFLRIIRPKRDDYALFISALLQTDYYSSYIQRKCKGTSINNVRADMLADFTFPFPPEDELPLISNVYGVLTRKILLNQKNNDTLQAMVRQLYDYWFVQFDFPDENGMPYKLSGGKMVWDEKLKKEIPIGWETLSINDLTTSCRGVSYDSSQVSDIMTPENDILVLRGNNINNNNIVLDSNTAYISSSLVSLDQHIRRHDIIMTMSSGSKDHLGKCGMFQFDSNHTFGAFLSKYTPRKDYHYYVFSFLTSDWYKAKIKSICNGTGINNLTNENFNQILLPVPPEKYIRLFNELVSASFDRIGENEKQNEILCKRRDELLPLLLSGQVSVKRLSE